MTVPRYYRFWEKQYTYRLPTYVSRLNINIYTYERLVHIIINILILEWPFQFYQTPISSKFYSGNFPASKLNTLCNAMLHFTNKFNRGLFSRSVFYITPPQNNMAVVLLQPHWCISQNPAWLPKTCQSQMRNHLNVHLEAISLNSPSPF